MVCISSAITQILYKRIISIQAYPVKKKKFGQGPPPVSKHPKLLLVFKKKKIHLKKSLFM